MRHLIPLAALAFAACSSGPDIHTAAGTTSGGDDMVPCPPECDDGNPCTVDACPGGKCTHVPLPGGTICEGSAADPIHSACDSPPAAVCQVTAAICVTGQPGDECVGGICSADDVCCSGGCIDADGHCTFGPAGGKPCPP